MNTTQVISSKERLVDVLQSIALNQQTGRLSIQHIGGQESEKGEIFFVNGEATFARTEQHTGETALFSMMHWTGVHYAFFTGLQIPTSTNRPEPMVQRPPRVTALLPIEMEETRQTPAIGMPILPVGMGQIRHTPAIGVLAILKGSRQTQASERNSSLKLPSSQATEDVGKIGQLATYAIFRTSPTVKIQQVIQKMERRERVVLLLLNGKRTLCDVARLIHRSEVEVARILVNFLKQGYIERIEA